MFQAIAWFFGTLAVLIIVFEMRKKHTLCVATMMSLFVAYAAYDISTRVIYKDNVTLIGVSNKGSIIRLYNTANKQYYTQNLSCVRVMNKQIFTVEATIVERTDGKRQYNLPDFNFLCGEK